MLVNVVDVPPLCNFILPAIVRTGPAGGRDLDRRRLAGAGQADEARDRRAVRRALRARWRCCSTTPAAGPRRRCPPTRTARSSSSRSSTAIPTRSSCCAPGDEQARARPDRRGAAPSPRLTGDRERERAHPPRRRGPRPHGRRRREARDRAPGGGAGGRPDVARDGAPRWRAGDAPKGDVLGVARIAGIQAAKRTAELIPLCHPLPLSFVDVEGDGRRRGRRDHARRRGAHERADRRGDGGADRRLGRRADRLRHGQGDRARRRDRLGGAAREVRRAVGHVAAGFAVAGPSLTVCARITSHSSPGRRRFGTLTAVSAANIPERTGA